MRLIHVTIVSERCTPDAIDFILRRMEESAESHGAQVTSLTPVGSDDKYVMWDLVLKKAS